jgi:hypothetical protein
VPVLEGLSRFDPGDLLVQVAGRIRGPDLPKIRQKNLDRRAQ